MRRWGKGILGAAERRGRLVDTYEQMRGAIEGAGFKNVRVVVCKMPFGGVAETSVVEAGGEVAVTAVEEWD